MKQTRSTVTRSAALLALGFFFAACGGRSFETPPPEPCEGDECGSGACTVGGEIYEDGATGIPAPDGCNTCSCNDGEVACTERACPSSCDESSAEDADSSGAAEAPVRPGCRTVCDCVEGERVCTQVDCRPSTCSYNGVTYQDGDSFSAGDGCNSCTCSDGEVACTLVGCDPDRECTASTQCRANEACQFPDGACGGQGLCVTVNQACDAVFLPVCGCDGVTYSNACQAQAGGVSVAYEGECSTPGSCGGKTCSPGQYCKLPVGICSLGVNADPAQGIGAPVPLPPGECVDLREPICPELYSPQCGCDGVTYGNLCEAEAAGVNILHAGTCAGEPCFENAGCAPDQYCAFPVGVCGSPAFDRGAAPAPDSEALIPVPLPEGTCQPRPQGCGDIYAPVCTCNGLTYENACTAASAGLNVSYESECPVALE